MADAVERLVNLALYFADASGTVTREQIRKEVAGYGEDQDEDAFLRMFERDKETLKSAGFVLVSDEAGNYRIDARATYAGSVDLTAGEAAALRTVGVALAADPSFPLAADLRLALAKIAAQVSDEPVHANAALVDEEPLLQGRTVAAAISAVITRKRVSFRYMNSLGKTAERTVEPYGVFLHDGRWYLVGRDTDKGDVRTYAVARANDFEPNPAAPKTPDFERPDDFDVAAFTRLPFQYGNSEFDAELAFDPEVAWRASRLAGGSGTLAEAADGGVQWRVKARSAERLVRFALDNGPGVRVTAPPEAVEAARRGLQEVVRAHGEA